MDPATDLSQVAGAITALAGGLPLLLALTALGVVAVVARPRDTGIWLMVACIVIPILGAAAISLVKPMFVGRYLIIVLPFVAVLAACALAALPGRGCVARRRWRWPGCCCWPSPSPMPIRTSRTGERPARGWRAGSRREIG